MSRIHARTWQGKEHEWNMRQLIRRDGNICGICHEPMAKKEMTIDHKLALSKGGADSIDNMHLAHAKCNHQRGNADLDTAVAFC